MTVYEVGVIRAGMFAECIRVAWCYSCLITLQVEAGKQSPIKLLRVLAGLRPWEICSPDVSAAIEFCRQRVVEMSVEEYEQWFSETFPSIIRPPVIIDAHKDSMEMNVEWNQATSRHHSRAIAKSAPPRFRQIRNWWSWPSLICNIQDRWDPPIWRSTARAANGAQSMSQIKRRVYMFRVLMMARSTAPTTTSCWRPIHIACHNLRSIAW